MQTTFDTTPEEKPQPVQMLERSGLGQISENSTGAGAGLPLFMLFGGVQTKLTVNQPGDPYEVEADRVAQAALNGESAPHAIRNSPNVTAQVQRSTNTSSCSNCGLGVAGTVQRKTAGGRNKNHPTIQFQLMVNQPGDAAEQEADRVATHVTGKQPSPTIRRRATSAATPEVTPESENMINASRGNGQTLTKSVRAPMEQSMGTDFSGVKVHTDSTADYLNRSLNARAFTTGQDIFFGQGEFSPGTSGGRELLAHELTHVVQQGNSIRRSNGTIQRLADSSQIDVLNAAFQAHNTQDSITAIRQLNKEEKDSVLGSSYYKSLAMSEGDDFGDESVYRLMNAITEGGYQNLYGCLDWMLYEFDEDSGWNWIEEIVSKHTLEERKRILLSEEMKRRFSERYGDAEIFVLIKDYLSGIDIEKSLEWLFYEADEGELTWKKVDEVLTLHKGQDMRKVLYNDALKKHFQVHFGEKEIYELLNYHLYGIDLAKSLEWMFFEAEPGEIYREQMRDVILKHPEEQKKAVREDEGMKKLFILHLTDFGVAMIVQALGLPLREQLEWMIYEDTNYDLVFDAFRVAYTQNPDEAEKVREDKSLMEKLKEEIGSHQYGLLLSFLETMGKPELSDEDLDDAEFIQNNEELIKQYLKVQGLKGLGPYGLLSALPAESKKLDEMRKGVDTTDWEIERTIARFIATFYRNALKLALQMLALSEQEIIKEGEKLGVTSRREDGFENLWQALQPARDLRVEFEDKVREIKGTGLASGIDALDSLWDYGVTQAHQFELYRLYEEFEKKYKELKENTNLVKLFPVMADKDLTLRRVWTDDKAELKSAVGGTVRDRYSDVQDARKNIAEEPGVIWELDQLIAMAKNMYGVKEGSAYEMIIDRKVEEETSSVWDALLTVLAIAFAILSFVPGLNAIGIIGGVIVGGISAGRSIADYMQKKTMSGTDFDRQKALSSEPSLFWVVMDVAFFAADIIAVTKIAKAVKPFMKTKAAAKASKEEVLEGLRTSVPQINPKNLKEGISPDDARKMLADNYAKEAPNMAKGAGDVSEEAAGISKNLDSARSKHQIRDMTEAEIDAELGQVRQNRPSKIKEDSEHFNKYDYEVEANGHVYRRRKDGKGWCRFSNNKDCELSAEAQSKLKQYEQDNSFPRQVDPDVEANRDLLEGIEEALFGGTWPQHQRAVVERLKGLNRYSNVGDAVQVRVTLSNGKTVDIIPDALVELPNGSFRIVDAKHQKHGLIAAGKKKIAETLTEKQSEAFPEIARGKILRAELVDNTAQKIVRKPGEEIRLDRTIEIHTNDELGGIVEMIYKP